MSVLFKARGSSSAGLLLIRLALGSYTLALGIQQASNIEGYINRVKAFGMFSENMSFVIGFILPFALILLGTLYIMGFFTPPTSFALALISLLKISSRGLFPTPGIPFNKDVIFFACFLLTLFAGAGIISFDAFLDKKKKRVVDIGEPPKAVVTAEVVTETPKPEQPAPTQESAGSDEVKP
jgi:uncharacterized membrane protein YphA (DoxX/SURF4 family)